MEELPQTVAEQLATFVVDTSYEELPDAVIHAARRSYSISAGLHCAEVSSRRPGLRGRPPPFFIPAPERHDFRTERA